MMDMIVKEEVNDEVSVESNEEKALKGKQTSNDIQVTKDTGGINDHGNDVQEPSDLKQLVIMKEESVLNQMDCEKIKKTGNEYKCEKCDYKSIRHYQVEQHMRAKHEGEGFQCDECGYWSGYKYHMKRHILKVHKPDKLDDIWNKTDKVSRGKDAKTIKSSEEVINIVKNEGIGPEKTRNKTTIATKVTRNTGGINDHGYDIQEPSDLDRFVRKDPTDLKYYCTICSSFYETNITRTRNHVESSHFPKMFTYHCDQCDGTFSTRSKLTVHKYRKHGMQEKSPKMMSDKIGKESKDEKILKRNKVSKVIKVTRNTEGSNDHGYDIKEPNDLKQFVRKDPTDLKYHCTMCSSFSQKCITSMRNHVESSHFPNMFTYYCDQCDSTFSTKKSYIMHKSKNHGTQEKSQKTKNKVIKGNRLKRKKTSTATKMNTITDSSNDQSYRNHGIQENQTKVTDTIIKEEIKAELTDEVSIKSKGTKLKRNKASKAIKVTRNTEGNNAQGYDIQEPSDLKQFVRKDESNKKFYCTMCSSFSQKRITNTRNHVESSHFLDMFTYHCDQCDKTFSTKSNYTMHKSRNHGKQAKKQLKINKVTDMIVKEEVKLELTGEVSVESKGKRLKRVRPSKAINVTRNPNDSNDQGYNIQEPNDLKQFVRKDPTDLKYHCTMCNLFSQNSITSTRNHVESSHFPNMFTYHCDKCDNTFSTKSNYTMHNSRQHGLQEKPLKNISKVTRNPDESPLPGYNFKEPCDLLRFVVRDTNNLKYNCTLCTRYSHKGSYSTRNHVESIHFSNMFTYHCDQCDSTFSTKSNYVMHKSKRHNPAQFECDECQYRSKYEHKIKKHKLKEHNPEKNDIIRNKRKLTYRGKKFAKIDISSEQSVVATIASGETSEDIVHDEGGEVEIKVEVDLEDKQGFFLAINETMQKKIEKGIKCEECSFSTNRPLNLKLHIKRAHQSTSNHYCTACSFVTTAKQYLSIHIKKRHKELDIRRPYRMITPREELPEHTFFTKCLKPQLFIDGFVLILNKYFLNEHGQKFAYFYCRRRLSQKCKARGKVHVEQSANEQTETTSKGNNLLDFEEIPMQLTSYQGLHSHGNDAELETELHSKDKQKGKRKSLKYRASEKSHVLQNNESEIKTRRRNKTSKVIKVTRNTGDSNDQGYNIQEPSDLRQFVKKDPTDLKYHCTMCSTFSQTSIISTRNHVESSHFPKMFTYHCDQCDKTFSTKSNYTVHQYRYHGTNEEESKTRQRISNRRIMTKTVKSETVYVRRNADSGDTTKKIRKIMKEKIKVTMNTDASNDDANVKKPMDLEQFVIKDQTDLKYYCTLCSIFSDPNISSARNHVESSHFPNMFTYHCDQCDDTFSTKENYKMHKSEKHNSMSNEINDDEKDHCLTCDLCGHVSTSSFTFYSHRGFEHGLKEFTCDKCEFQTTITELKIHEREVHKGRSHPCSYCEHISDSPSHLNAHIETKHEFVYYPCEQCDKKYKTPHMLKIHVDTDHNGVLHKCPHCFYVSKQKGHFKHHIKTMHLGQLHKCGDCKQEFNHTQALKKHTENVHNTNNSKVDVNEKVAKCSECSFVSRSKSSLNVHIQTLHLGKPCKCDICGFECQYLHILKEHKRSEHPKKKRGCVPDGLSKKPMPKRKQRNQNKPKQTIKVKVTRNPDATTDYGNDIQEPSDLTKFIRKDPNEKRFHCTLCSNYSQTCIFHTRIHVEAIHFPKMFTYHCDLCDTISSSRRNYTNHVKTFHKSSKHGLDVKPMKMKPMKKKSLKKRKKSVIGNAGRVSRNPDVSNAYDAKCQICDYKSKTKRQVTVHNMIKHEGARFRCYQCEYWSANTGNMKRHLKIKHTSKKPDDERMKTSSEKMFSVSSDFVVAGEEVLSYEADEIEIKIEPGLEENSGFYLERKENLPKNKQQRVSNSICNAIINDIVNNLNIEEATNLRKDTVASILNFEMVGESHAGIAMTDRTENTPYKVMVMKRHVPASHVAVGERIYRCEECKATFKNNGHKDRHMLTHTGEKNFICEICNKGFNRKDTLKKHSRIHGNIPKPVDHVQFVWQGDANKETVIEEIEEDLDIQVSDDLNRFVRQDPTDQTFYCTLCTTFSGTALASTRHHVESSHFLPPIYLQL